MSSEAESVVVAAALSKQHRLYRRPMDRLRQWVARGRRQYFDEIWALNHVSFDVAAGESVGIVGRNGSGKSTLLQIVAGILPPSGGQVTVKGRIAALLELGAGFNGDFTGRDNVVMNAAVIGLTREEIDARMDDIIAFADIGPFIDHPVKTYSSGMYVRLAFALAVSVDPDILIVDEALAVGDEVFQNKCYGRIADYQSKGGTLLFVSHSPQMVTQFCQRALLLDQGELLMDGLPRDVISAYRRYIHAPVSQQPEIREELQSGTEVPVDAPESLRESLEAGMIPDGRTEFTVDGARILNPRIETAEGETVNVLVRGRNYAFCFDAEFDVAAEGVAFQMIFRTHTGYALGGKRSGKPGDLIAAVAAGQTARVRFEFPCRLFPETHYTVSCAVTAERGGETVFLHRIIDCVMFRVSPEAQLWSQGIVDFDIEPHWTFEEGVD